MITIYQNLLNNGSKSMNVNGGTPQTFSYSPSAPTALIGLMCILKHDGNTSLSNFGALAKLTNGLLIQASLGGNTTVMANIKDNADLCKCFHFNQFGNGAILSLLGVATAEGFGNSNNIFIGFMELHLPNFMTMQPGDSIQVVVQDDLRNITILEITAKISIDQ